MTLPEFLAWEERQALRYEFNGFRPVGMMGGTIAHDRIIYNIQRVLDGRLEGKRCRPLGPNVKIVANGKVYYPDAFVTCRRFTLKATIADDPVVVFARRDEDWLTEIVSGDDAVLRLPEIGIEVPLDELYRNADLEPLPDDGR